MRARAVALPPSLPALALLCFSLAWCGAMVMRPVAGQPVAALFPPGLGDEVPLARALAAGAAAVQGFGAWKAVVVTRSERADFVERLYGNGAWLVVRAAGSDCSQ